MIERKKLRTDKAAIVQPYLLQMAERPDIHFINSGCCLLNCVLGGGYPLGRITNIVGDKSTGKTLLAIEALINFLRDYPDGVAYYVECESAFDRDYAASLGMPVDKIIYVDRNEISTIEDWYKHMETVLSAKHKGPIFYVLDSLDSLSDDAELEREIDKSSYGGSKAKKLSEFFRRLVQRIESENMNLFIVSQIRENIGVTFGDKYKRSGGKALDFYASQVFWLAQIGRLDREIDKIKRVTGLNIKVKITKNKVGLAFRDCEMPLVFGYGIDDLQAAADWLTLIGKAELIKAAGLTGRSVRASIQQLIEKGPEYVAPVRKALNASVVAEWQRIEAGFLSPGKKY